MPIGKPTTEMAQMLSDIEVSGLSLGTERKASNGVLSIPVLYKGQRGCEVQLPGEVTCLFPPSSFDAGSRMTITLLIDPETADAVARLESAVAALGALKSPHTAIRRTEGLSPSFKLKFDPDRVQVVSAGGERIPMPVAWGGLRLKAIVCLRSAYKQAANSGVLWDLAAVQVVGTIPPKQVVFK
jgi:hypothetical protein